LFERYIVITILFGTQDGYPWPDNWREEWKESSVCDWRTPLGIGVFCDAGGLIRELSLRKYHLVARDSVCGAQSIIYSSIALFVFHTKGNLYVGEEFPPEIGLLSNLQVLSLGEYSAGCVALLHVFCCPSDFYDYVSPISIVE
jgi:hypothetical protein